MINIIEFQYLSSAFGRGKKLNDRRKKAKQKTYWEERDRKNSEVRSSSKENSSILL